jgi:hypothetical protein
MRILLALLTGFSLQAAATVVVKPSVNEDLVPCNAGILHAGTELYGSDYIQVQYEDMNVVATHPSHFRANTLQSNPTVGDYQVLFSDSDSWSSKITQLSFNLSTEKTGAAYFVDFCYLGPIENLKNMGHSKKDLSEGIYTLTASVSSTDLTSNNSYRTQVDLQTKVEFICDLRKRGKNQDPRVATELEPTGTMDADALAYADFSRMGTSGVAFEKDLNNQNSQVPRFCRLRVSFLESVVTDRSNVLSNAETTVFLDIQQN